MKMIRKRIKKNLDLIPTDKMYQSCTKLRSVVNTRKVRRTFISFYKVTIILGLMVS